MYQMLENLTKHTENLVKNTEDIKKDLQEVKEAVRIIQTKSTAASVEVPDTTCVENPFDVLRKFGFKAKSQKEVSELCIIVYICQ